MPELPEVETIRKDLNKVLIGKIIKQITIKIPKMIGGNVYDFKKKLLGQKIIKVDRAGKTLIITLTENYLLVHLKMTGQLIWQSVQGKMAGGGHPIVGNDVLPNKFSHLIFVFTDQSRLFFNDVRKFGWMKIVSVVGLQEYKQKLGIEPLNRSFTVIKLKEIIKRWPKRKIKQLLLDQSLISGLGNIYVDESCFTAKILPTRLAGSLNNQEIINLFTSIKKILKLAIKKRGTSISDYVDGFGKRGEFVNFLQVYGRKGEKCQRCSGIIEKIKLNGRGTHFCSKCQK